MADYSDLLKQIPVADIAKQVGVSPDVASEAINQILPTLVSGMSANAKTPEGAASLEKALTSHTGKKITSVSDVDTADGEKIVKNVFGSNKEAVEKAVASNTKSPNATQQIIAQILPIVAPIVIAWIASQFLGGASTSTTSTSKSNSSSTAGGIGGLLGGLLSNPETQSAIGGVLGGLLGGGKK
ncbi:MAG: DUF937 domain-containing protein [Actinomycetota bacterium]